MVPNYNDQKVQNCKHINVYFDIDQIAWYQNDLDTNENVTCNTIKYYNRYSKELYINQQVDDDNLNTNIWC